MVLTCRPERWVMGERWVMKQIALVALICVIKSISASNPATALNGRDQGDSSPLRTRYVYEYPKRNAVHDTDHLRFRPTPSTTLFLQPERSRLTEHIVSLRFRRVEGISGFRVDDLIAMDTEAVVILWRHIATLAYPGLSKKCRSLHGFTPSLATSPSRQDLIIHNFGPWDECNVMYVWRDMTLRKVVSREAHTSSASYRYLQSIVTLADTDDDEKSYWILAYGELLCNNNRTKWEGSTDDFMKSCKVASRLRRVRIHTTKDGSITIGTWEVVAEAQSPVRPGPILLPSLVVWNNTLILHGGLTKTKGYSIMAWENRKIFCTLWMFDLHTRRWTRHQHVINACLLVSMQPSVTGLMFQRPRAVLFGNQSQILIHFLQGSYLCSLSSSSSDTPQCRLAVSRKNTRTPEIGQFYAVSATSGAFYGIGKQVFSLTVKTSLEIPVKGLLSVVGHEFVENNIYASPSQDLQFPGQLGCLTPTPVVQGRGGQERVMFFPTSKCFLETERKVPEWHAGLYDWTPVVWTLTVEADEYEIMAMRNCDSKLFESASSTSLSIRTAILFGYGYTTIDTLAETSITWCIGIDHNTCDEFVDKGKAGSPSMRYEHVAVRLDDRRLLVYGGRERSTALPLSDVWILHLTHDDRCEGAWKKVQPHSIVGGPLAMRYGHAAMTHGDLHYVFGGHVRPDVCSQYLTVLRVVMSNSTETLRVRRIPLTSCVLTRRYATLTRYNQNGLLVFGGDKATLSQLILLNFSSMHTVAKLLPLFTHSRIRKHHVVRGEKLYLFGGTDGSTSIAVGSRQKYRTITEGLCPRGYQLLNANCQPCQRGAFSDSLDSGCRPCPNFTTSEAEGSEACIAPSPCRGQLCSEHGVCVVDNNLIPVCHCNFGFVQYDNCRVPLVSLSIATAILLFVSAIALATRKYHNRNQQLKLKERELRDKHKSMRLYQKKLDQINIGARIQWTSLNRTKKLARGSFSQVWLAEFSDMLVAVKVLPKYSGRNISLTDHFIQEAEVLRSIRHPNIVIFLGAGTDHASKRPFLVMEYLRRGSLYHVLHDRDNVFTHHDRLRFALDTARGMAYLHGSNPPRLHRDLKSPNLLVSDKWVVKIGDLGTSRFMAILDPDKADNQTTHSADVATPTTTLTDTQGDENLLAEAAEQIPTEPARIVTSNSGNPGVNTEQEETSLTTPLLTDISTNHGETYQRYSASVMTREVGTLRWKSPETVRGEHYNEKADVYSFGVVLWEIFTRQTPYVHLKGEGEVEAAIARGHQLPLPPGMPYDYRHLVEACLRPTATERPNFSEIPHDLETQQANA